MAPRFALAALIALVLSAVPASAAPIPVGEAYGLNFHAETCFFCMPQNLGALPNITMDGVLTVIDVTNAVFYDPVYGFGPGGLYYTTGTLITDVSGTMTVDCAAANSARCSFGGSYTLSFAQAPRGDGSYLLGGTPIVVHFAANGAGSTLVNDRFRDYLYAPGVNQVPMSWTQTRVAAPSVSVPDPSSSIALSVTAMVCLVGLFRISRLALL